MLVLEQKLGDSLVITNMETYEKILITTVMVADSSMHFLPTAKVKLSIDSPDKYNGKPKYSIDRIKGKPEEIAKLLDHAGNKRAGHRIDKAHSNFNAVHPQDDFPEQR